jgi:hypothetical protein
VVIVSNGIMLVKNDIDFFYRYGLEVKFKDQKQYQSLAVLYYPTEIYAKRYGFRTYYREIQSSARRKNIVAVFNAVCTIVVLKSL